MRDASNKSENPLGYVYDVASDTLIRQVVSDRRMGFIALSK